MRRACILAGPLLLALAALVTAESCDAPTLCRRYVSPAPKIIGIGSQKAQPPRADLPSRHGRPPPPSPRSPVCKKPQTHAAVHGPSMLVLGCVAGAAGAACGAGAVVLWQQSRRRRRRLRRASPGRPPERTIQLPALTHPPARSPWAGRRASMPAHGAAPAALRQPPPPARSRSLLVEAASGEHARGSIIARVSSDAPCLAMYSPFASCAAQSSEHSHSPAAGRNPRLPTVGSAASTVAGVLEAAAARAALARPAPANPTRLSLSLSKPESSGDTWQRGGADDLPAHSPCIRASLSPDGCITPVRPPSTPSLGNSEGNPSTRTGAAVPHASTDPTMHHSTLSPDGCQPAAAPGEEEPQAAEQGAPLLPADWAAHLGAGSLPDALRRCLVHPTEICFLYQPGGLLQRLGEGASATVFRAQFRGQAVAVKVMHVGHSAEAQRAFVTEAARMQQLRHDNIVGFLGISLDGPNALLVMEYCAGLDLLDSLQVLAGDGSGRRLFGWWRRGRRVALHLARALAHLHSLGIVHMDVKSSNVLLTAQGGAKLCDVGLSHVLESMNLSTIACTGTFAWAAPEVLLGSSDCGQPADIYSFGVVLWELLTGERPVRGNLRLPRVPEECPQEVADLMLLCLSTDPTARPTAAHLVVQLEALMPLRPSLQAAASEPAS